MLPMYRPSKKLALGGVDLPDSCHSERLSPAKQDEGVEESSSEDPSASPRRKTSGAPLRMTLELPSRSNFATWRSLAGGQ